MPDSHKKIFLSTICSTPEELFSSCDFQKVLDLFNRDRLRHNPQWENIALEQVLTTPTLAEDLYVYWEKHVFPRILSQSPCSNRSLDNEEHSRLADVVNRSLLYIAKNLPEPSFSGHRLEVFRRGARELMNNGYVPILFRKGENPFGEPVYPIDVHEKHTEPLRGEDKIKVLQMPQVRHNGERIEFTNFVEPEDPAKIQAIAESGELGFTQKERDVSHISFATCLVDKKNNRAVWSETITVPNARFASHPLEQMRQYGSGLFEGIGVERGVNGNVYVFRLRDHWERMSLGGQYYCLPPIPYEIFEKMVIDTVKANWAYIPPQGKGRLYIRPNWWDIGPKMHVGTSGENVLMMTAVPIGAAQSYYKKSATTIGKEKEDKGMTIFFPYNVHRSTENGPGQTKADGNYGATVPHIEAAEKEDMMGVMYMNEKGTAVEETNASSLIFLQILPGAKTPDGKQKYKLLTPSLERGTVLNSITRKTILTLAKEELYWEVADDDIDPDKLESLITEGKVIAAFSAGTGAVLTPIHNIQRGNIHIRDTKNDKGEWIRTFEIEKNTHGSIEGKHMNVGKYDPENPYTDAGKALLQVLLDAKSGKLQEKRAKEFLECEGKDCNELLDLRRLMHEYQGWLTVVDPPEVGK